MIVDTKEFFKRKALYAENKVSFCINYFCISNARFEGAEAPLKQRQECDKCKNHALNPNTVARQTGWLFRFNETPKNNINIINIEAIPKYVVNAYTNMCYNNYSKEYWGTTPMRLDEVKREDVFINEETGELKDEYIFKYKNPISRKLEPILVNNIPYLCELRRPWYTYGNGLIELDHKDGKHTNNTVKNIQPLCKICHGIKTDQQQDKSSIIKELEKKENADSTDLTFQETINRYDRRFKTDSNAENFIAILNKNTFNEIKRKYYLLENDEPVLCYKTINKIWMNEIEPVPLLSEEEYNKFIGDEVIIHDKQLELQVKDENKIGVNNDYGKLVNEMNPSPAQLDLLAEQVAIQNPINEVDIAAAADLEDKKRAKRIAEDRKEAEDINTALSASLSAPATEAKRKTDEKAAKAKSAQKSKKASNKDKAVTQKEIKAKEKAAKNRISVLIKEKEDSLKELSIKKLEKQLKKFDLDIDIDKYKTDNYNTDRIKSLKEEYKEEEYKKLLIEDIMELFKTFIKR